MATKVKPSRINVTGVPSVGQVPMYVDDDTFQWGNGGGGGDMLYSDFYWDSESGASITLSLSTEISPTTNFTVNAPVTIEEGQVYILRVTNGATAYTMTLGTNVNNTQGTDTTLTANATDMFVFLGVGGALELQKEIDNVTVVDNLTSTSSTDALSANQGKVLNDKISDLFGLGKFLSLWDATTGLPTSFPLQTPYTYTAGDYFLVETVSTATPPVNYKPTGSSYTGTASSTTESEELEVGDVYIYDGSVWLLQSNHGKSVTFANIAGQPTDNSNLATALSAKADDNAVVKLTGNQTVAGTKTFSTSPVVPSKTSDATNTGTAIATEAQVYKKQDALTTQTAYTSKGTSTAVPTITTNTLGQVTAVSETNIAFPVTSVNSNTGAVTVSEFSPTSSGTTGQVLTKTAGGYDWAAPAGGGIQNDTTGTTTTVTAIRAGTSTEYSNLGTYDSSTIYHIY